jgi:hypothetical protein
MARGPREPPRWWRGKGRGIEEALLVGACAAAGALVAAALDMNPGVAAVLTGGAALIAVRYRR